MGLPKLDKPIFDIDVPILNKQYKCRPYLVKEEKILLLAQQSGEFKQIVNATKQIINNCIIDEEIDFSTMPYWALEWIILQLRIQSAGETVTVQYQDNEDNEVYKFEIDLTEIDLTSDPDHSDTVEITDSLFLKMKYPTLDHLTHTEGLNTDNVSNVYNLIKMSIETVYSDDEMFEFGNYSEEEKTEFIDQFDTNSLLKVAKFFDGAPTIKHDITYTNKNDKERKIELRSLNDFFI